jgi:uncharacterized DUF497 family protein
MSGVRRRPRFEAIEFDGDVLASIAARHGVSFDEIEQVCHSHDLLAARGRDGLYQLFGRTLAGRYLLVVLADRGGGVCAPLTARGMTGREWRIYQGAPQR